MKVCQGGANGPPPLPPPKCTPAHTYTHIIHTSEKSTYPVRVEVVVGREDRPGVWSGPWWGAQTGRGDRQLCTAGPTACGHTEAGMRRRRRRRRKKRRGVEVGGEGEVCSPGSPLLASQLRERNGHKVQETVHSYMYMYIHVCTYYTCIICIHIYTCSEPVWNQISIIINWGQNVIQPASKTCSISYYPYLYRVTYAHTSYICTNILYTYV